MRDRPAKALGNVQIRAYSRRSAMVSGLLISGSMMLPRCVMAAPIRANARVEALLSRMTIEEKVGQLTLYPDDVRPTPRPINPDINAQAEAQNRGRFQVDEIRAGRVGALLAGTGVAKGRDLQKAALSSRLGIPLLFGADIVHGFRTIFPIPLALAASFDPDLAERTARAAAEEATAVGVHWTCAPMVDVARDQRWGRVAETSGEDTYLATTFARAYVRGFQGDDLRSDRSLLACPKHFAGYGAVLGGMDYNTTDLTERELRQTHLPQFAAAFAAGAITTMAAFVDVDGIPASGNRHLLTQILREEMGMNGFVVSDAASAEELVAHGYAANEEDAALKAILAGLDVNMGGGLFKRHLAPLVQSGKLPMTTLDEAVRRVLTVKDAIGLFEHPFRSLDSARERRDVRTPAALKLARSSAARSVVLLQNNGNVLPFARSKKIALIGPLADDPENLNGPWAPWGKAAEGITLAAGLRRTVDQVTIAKGCDILAPIAGGIDAALAAARDVDIVVLALGESQDMSGEAHSRSDITLPDCQRALARAISALGKPVVVVLSTGRALALDDSVTGADAILVAWFLGSESGNALSDILLGKVSPSGRLPVSFPQRSGQQPFFYNHTSTGRPQLPGEAPFYKARYMEVSNEPLFPFGFGLGYAAVSYGATNVDQPRMGWDATITISAQVRNVGDQVAEDVAQLYLHDVAASVTRPVRELKGYRRIALQPGKACNVEFQVSRRDLEFVGSDLKWQAEPGEFLAWISPNARDGVPTRFTLEPA